MKNHMQFWKVRSPQIKKCKLALKIQFYIEIHQWIFLQNVEQLIREIYALKSLQFFPFPILVSNIGSFNIWQQIIVYK